MKPLKILRYEDMLGSPIETFCEATMFIGLNFSNNKIEKALERSSFDNLQKQEMKDGFHEKNAYANSFLRKGIAGDWRNTLTEKQVKRIVEAHGEVMERFGYLNDI